MNGDLITSGPQSADTQPYSASSVAFWALLPPEEVKSALAPQRVKHEILRNVNYTVTFIFLSVAATLGGVLLRGLPANGNQEREEKRKMVKIGIASSGGLALIFLLLGIHNNRNAQRLPKLDFA